MSKEVRIAAIGDIHCTRKSRGAFRELFQEVSREADVLILCGDLTDYGLNEETQILASEIKEGLTIPSVAVLGNHDHEAGEPQAVAHILGEAGVTVLDGDSCEIEGIGFAGVKGFGGGFGARSVAPWGERALKAFVEETVHEALKLESALQYLCCSARLAVLHYSPIEATVRGEPLEIYPFLGSRRLEEPLNRYPVNAVFHGHAHKGSPEGRLACGTPVYNVAAPLMRRTNPDGKPYRIIRLRTDDEPPKSSTAEAPTGPTSPS